MAVKWGKALEANYDGSQMEFLSMSTKYSKLGVSPLGIVLDFSSTRWKAVTLLTQDPETIIF